MKKLILIPARGGSKGVPDKNIKLLNGKPLIQYSLEIAKELADEADICVSTDSQRIIEVVESLGVKVPFVRPEALATDKAGSYEVMLHALDHYESMGKSYDVLILLQPTSPFRNVHHVKEALKLFHKDIEMVVGVSKPKANPYFSLFEEDDNGYLVKSKSSNYERRQDCPPVYEYNGAIYIMNTKALRESSHIGFTKVVKFEMSEIHSHDIDTQLDWLMAETIMKYAKTSLDEVN